MGGQVQEKVLIEEAAAQDAVKALVMAELIEEVAAEEAVEAILESEEVKARST
jgi:hypothetical protein